MTTEYLYTIKDDGTNIRIIDPNPPHGYSILFGADRICKAFRQVLRERDGLNALLQDEISANIAFRESAEALIGKVEHEDMHALCERILTELSHYRSQCAVAWEFHNPESGSAIVDYDDRSHLALRPDKNGYKAKPLVYRYEK
jgi:hypothetical protein